MIPLRPFHFQKEKILLRLHRATTLLTMLLALLLVHQQAGSLTVRQTPGAGSREDRSGYFWITCPNENRPIQRLITPLPNTRYLYSDHYGWFDSTHFDTGNPAQIIADMKTAVANDGGIITISQPIRNGLTGYTANYLVSGDIRPEEITGAALGIYMDWSLRFEAWQGRAPRSLVGPFTPFAIEDLPTQYLGFFEDANHLNRAVLFTCFLDAAETAEAPPHLWLTSPVDGLELPQIERLTNKSFEPLVLTENGWEHVAWPASLRLAQIPSSGTTWVFDSEETWYLPQNMP